MIEEELTLTATWSSAMINIITFQMAPNANQKNTDKSERAILMKMEAELTYTPSSLRVNRCKCTKTEFIVCQFHSIFKGIA
jgi:hypothetical protein